MQNNQILFKKIIVFEKYAPTDSNGAIKGSPVEFKEELIYKCQRLNQWLRVDEFLFRIEELYWYLEIKPKGSFHSMSLQDILAEITPKIDCKISVFAKKVHDYINSTPTNAIYHYSRFMRISRSEVEKMDYSEVMTYLIKK